MLVSEPTENLRGLGVADMIDGILKEKDFQASGELAYHLLEMIDKILEC